jgi:hypothetical protein
VLEEEKDVSLESKEEEQVTKSFLGIYLWVPVALLFGSLLSYVLNI